MPDGPFWHPVCSNTGRALRLAIRSPIYIWCNGHIPLELDGPTVRSMDMTENKKKKVLLPKKTYWHLYSLQTLESDKLVSVVNKVLKSEYVLIK